MSGGCSACGGASTGIGWYCHCSRTWRLARIPCQVCRHAAAHGSATGMQQQPLACVPMFPPILRMQAMNGIGRSGHTDLANGRGGGGRGGRAGAAMDGDVSSSGGSRGGSAGAGPSAGANGAGTGNRIAQAQRKKVQRGLEANVKCTVYISYIDQQVCVCVFPLHPTPTPTPPPGLPVLLVN